MWILSSLGRPDRIRKVIQSYEWGEESQVLLVLYSKDERLPEYVNQKWPANFRIEIVDVEGNGPTYNEILRRFPNEPCYGFLADDAILDVQGMLRALELAAGGWNIAYANDKHHGEAICTMPCIGGELVRAVGYLSPDALTHSAIDCAWHEIGKRLGVLRYFEHLTYTHEHPLFGTAPMDKTYLRAQLCSAQYEQLYRGWMVGGELDAIVERVNKLKAAA
jgi:hypothetical protein